MCRRDTFIDFLTKPNFEGRYSYNRRSFFVRYGVRSRHFLRNFKATELLPVALSWHRISAGLFASLGRILLWCLLSSARDSQFSRAPRHTVRDFVKASHLVCKSAFSGAFAAKSLGGLEKLS